MEKVPHDADEETCWRRSPTTEIVAEAEAEAELGLMKQESRDSSEETEKLSQLNNR